MESHTIQFYEFTTKTVASLSSSSTMMKLPSALAVFGDKVYCADQDDASIHVVDKTTGVPDSILRTNIDNVLALKIYDPELQTGSNACSFNRGNCSHLCLPISATMRVCKCATGFSAHPTNLTACIGADSFILYSLNWEIKGVALEPSKQQAVNQTNRTEVLGPISRVQMATSVDFVAVQDLIYWVDSDHGSIFSIRRDGTHRKVIAEGLDSVESLAIDWISSNMYWTNPKFDVIEVSKINGSFKVLVFFCSIN
jgi:integrin beta 2